MKSITVNLTDISGKTSQGQVHVESWTPKQRLKRALRILAILWGIAVACIFVPVFHFFLVPLFIISGIIVATIVGLQRSTVLGGQGVCPHCQKTVSISKCAEAWPLKESCEHCRQNITVDALK